MNTDKILTGWNTWDTYSATTYVHMPEGYGVRIGLKEYLRGQYLQYPNIGRLGETDEKIRPGLHAYDGSYTELELEWRRIALKIQTAVRDDSLIIRIEPVSNTTRFIPSIVLEGVVLWNMPAVCRKDGQGIVWDAGGKTKRLQLISGVQNDDTYMPVSGPFVSIQIDQAVCFSIGEKYTPEQADEIIRENKEKMLTYASEKYKGYAQAWIGMQTSLAWNLIYDSKNKRPMINVSRLWNIDRGGYALFCWDNFFMGFMAAIDAPELGKNNIIENLKEVEELGFVPNGSFGNGRKSFDRSQPPVGTMCVWEVYKMDKDEEFLKEAFDLLLRWNRWWMEKRYNGGLLSWGSDDYDNKWEMDGIHETFGASLESGMDNSPMYIPEEVYFNPEKNILELWDVALNSMYIYDCEHLADIAGILGRNEEKELRERAEAFKKLFPRLWNDELGIYCNYKTDEQKFSTVLSPCNFYALMTGLPDDRQAERMMKEHFMNPEEFYGDWIMPSIARNHPMYPENTYWRGRIWAPLNFLVYMGMRRYEGLPETRILVDKSMELFMKEWTEHGHVHENYNSENGYGDDVLNSDRNYAWGGLLVLMTLMEEGRFRKQDGVYLQIHSKIGGVRIGKMDTGLACLHTQSGYGERQAGSEDGDNGL